VRSSLELSGSVKPANGVLQPEQQLVKPFELLRPKGEPCLFPFCAANCTFEPGRLSWVPAQTFKNQWFAGSKLHGGKSAFQVYAGFIGEIGVPLC
jgi:hypothetical protein